MSCFKENLNGEKIKEIVQSISNSEYDLVVREVDDVNQSAFASFKLEEGIFLAIIAKENEWEMFIIKNIGFRAVLLYRDDEIQMLSGKHDLSNIMIRNQNEIIFNFYEGSQERTRETRLNRERRRANQTNLIQRGKSMEFDTNLLPIDLSKYTEDSCILQYFERNDLVNKGKEYERRVHGYQFIDLPIEMI